MACCRENTNSSWRDYRLCEWATNWQMECNVVKCEGCSVWKEEQKKEENDLNGEKLHKV